MICIEVYYHSDNIVCMYYISIYIIEVIRLPIIFRSLISDLTNHKGLSNLVF